ncbi:MAG: phosphoribosylamine--glycine ligase [Candidatus Methanospirareceae archaeon]
MERVGVLVISYGSRASAVIEALKRSEEYEVGCYVADRQRNPFNVENAEKHVVIRDLSVEKICKFVEDNKEKIDFGICCPEAPIIGGVRDEIEEKTGIKMICPTRKYAIERSKILQRELLEECCKEANPRFKIFKKEDYKSFSSIKEAVSAFLDEIGNEVVVKPDRPAAGKGVGVWGDHFTTRDQLFEHLLSIYNSGSDVIIEEKLEGEESSFQAFCDGKRIEVLPETRDYKRAFDNDMGPNTGGMGSYKDKGDILPFMEEKDREEEKKLVEKIFKKLRGNGSNEGLRGMPFYVAFMHTSEGAKILEINSRPGDPEIQNILPVMKNDFVDVCFRMIEGNLSRIECEAKATVVTYAVPLDYGGYRRKYSGDRRVDLGGAYALKEEKYGDNLRIYPGSLELREDGHTYALSSRTVCTVGIGESIEEAREISLDGIRSIDGALWNRWDIGARHYIERSVRRMKELRKRK